MKQPIKQQRPFLPSARDKPLFVARNNNKGTKREAKEKGQRE